MPRVLIVEDDLDFRKMLETMIRVEWYDVSLADSGESGFSQAQAKKPDIVVSDISMPGSSGFDLARRVKSTPGIDHCYFILLTGQGTQESKFDALRAGADDFIEKPSNRTEILGRLEIAQKVLAVQRLQRDAEEKVKSLEGIPARVLASADTLDQAIKGAEEAIAKKNAPALVAALKAAREASALIRGACGSAGSQPEGSWL
jgi:DNA-binding response OmpR family regulator